MSVSLVMATVDRSHEILHLVDTLKAQTDPDFELIVVDQNKDDRLKEVVRYARHAGLTVRHERVSERNLSVARNRGIELARHDIVAFPDDDCWYGPDVVQRVNEFMAGTAVQGPEEAYARRSGEPAAGGSPLHSGQRYVGVVARWYEQDPQGRPPQDIALEGLRRFRTVLPSSISIFLRKHALASVGGFDRRLGVARYFGAGEEIDLILRILAAGGRIRYLPEALVHHALSTTRRGTIAQMCKRARDRERGTGAIYAKHRLPAAVIMRGLAAPVLKALVPPTGVRALLDGACVSMGRLQGWLRWRDGSAD